MRRPPNRGDLAARVPKAVGAILTAEALGQQISSTTLAKAMGTVGKIQWENKFLQRAEQLGLLHNDTPGHRKYIKYSVTPKGRNVSAWEPLMPRDATPPARPSTPSPRERVRTMQQPSVKPELNGLHVEVAELRRALQIQGRMLTDMYLSWFSKSGDVEPAIPLAALEESRREHAGGK